MFVIDRPGPLMSDAYRPGTATHLLRHTPPFIAKPGAIGSAAGTAFQRLRRRSHARCAAARTPWASLLGNAHY